MHVIGIKNENLIQFVKIYLQHLAVCAMAWGTQYNLSFALERNIDSEKISAIF